MFRKITENMYGFFFAKYQIHRIVFRCPTVQARICLGLTSQA
jgi:hypothetical protein